MGVEGVYSLNDGARLVKAAREAIELSIMSPEFRQEMLAEGLSEFNSNHGAFVRIMHYPTESKRGHACLVDSKLPLKETVPQLALCAFNNSRAVPVSHMEFEDMIIALGIITEVKEIKNREISWISDELRPGTAGLALQFGYNEGFVFTENTGRISMPEEFLHELCDDAGLQPFSWKNPKAKLYRFHAQIFLEKEPHGDIEEIFL